MHERVIPSSSETLEISPQEQVIESTLSALAQDLHTKGDTSAIVVRRSAMENEGNEDWYALFYGERGDRAYFGVRVKYPRTEYAEVSIVANGTWRSMEYYADIVKKSRVPQTDALGFFFRPGWEKRPIEEKIAFAASIHTVGKMDMFHFFDGYDEREVPLQKALRQKRLFDHI